MWKTKQTKSSSNTLQEGLAAAQCFPPKQPRSLPAETTFSAHRGVMRLPAGLVTPPPGCAARCSTIFCATGVQAEACHSVRPQVQHHALHRCIGSTITIVEPGAGCFTCSIRVWAGSKQQSNAPVPLLHRWGSAGRTSRSAAALAGTYGGTLAGRRRVTGAGSCGSQRRCWVLAAPALCAAANPTCCRPCSEMRCHATSMRA